MLFFIHIGSRKVYLGGITENPDGKWMRQVARNLTMDNAPLNCAKYLIMDGDGKYRDQIFREWHRDSHRK